MPTVAFTARWVATVKPPASGQVDYFDASPPGVGLRVAPSGRKTWFVMYRVNGRLRRLTLGTYPVLSLADARRQAFEARHAVVHGEDPATHKQQARQAPLFSHVAAEYIEKYSKVRKKTWRDDARILAKDVLPHWGTRAARDIRRRDVLVLLDGLVSRGHPIQANRLLALVRRVFNWCISRDILDQSPCLQVTPPGKEHQRDRVLTAEEIRAVWDACAQLDPVMGAYYRFRLLTAQRGGETRRMRWAEVELHTGWWTIPASMAKNGLAHRVPLSRPALAILARLRETTDDGEWVFPSSYRRSAPVSRSHKPFQRLKAATGIAFWPHDLRRTAASHMTSMGISRLVVAKILNHAEPGVTKVYDRHSYDQEKRQALEAWGDKVLALVEKGHTTEP